MKKALLCSLAFLFTLSCATQAEKIDVRFGVLEYVRNGFSPIIDETTTIPYILNSKDTAFGINISNDTDGTVEYKIVLASPGAAANDVGDKRYDAMDGNTIFASPSYLLAPHGKQANCFWLSKGDPHGDWKVLVIVNGAPYKKFDVTVLPPE